MSMNIPCPFVAQLLALCSEFPLLSDLPWDSPVLLHPHDAPGRSPGMGLSLQPPQLDVNSMNFKVPSVQEIQLSFCRQLCRETLNWPEPCRKGSNLHLHHAKPAFAPVWDPPLSYPTFLVRALPLPAPFCYLAQYFTVLMYPKSF